MAPIVLPMATSLPLNVQKMAESCVIFDLTRVFLDLNGVKNAHFFTFFNK